MMERSGKWFVYRSRAAGSSSVYWGPFDSVDDCFAWVKSRGLTFSVGFVQMHDPGSDESTWWEE